MEFSGRGICRYKLTGYGTSGEKLMSYEIYRRKIVIVRINRIWKNLC